MAGDWIKMTTNLHECPEVIQLSAATKKNRFDIVGRLHRVWSWYDAHTSDGHAKGVTFVTIDELASCDGFATAMVDVGWLEEIDGDLVMVKFDRHNGESAKKRAEATERKRLSRKKCDIGHANPVTETRPEKRREESITTTTTPTASGVEAGLAKKAEQIVAAYPKRRKVSEAQKIVLQQLNAGASYDEMLSGTLKAAEFIHTKVPSGHLNEFIPGADTFFLDRRWLDDPELLIRRKETPQGRGKHNGSREDIGELAAGVKIYDPKKNETSAATGSERNDHE